MPWLHVPLLYFQVKEEGYISWNNLSTYATQPSSMN